mgnify:CR=1 FL=1
MAKYIMSAFADEAASNLDEQIEALKKEDVSKIELRGVDGTSCVDLSIEKAKEVHKKLSAAGITLSALGSSYGKISIYDPFEQHLEKLKKSLEVCHILECDKIRVFSFYLPKEEAPEKFRDEVLRRMEKMIEAASAEGILLAHENEKGIYGDTDDRCIDLYNAFGGKLGVIFDPANYIQCGVNPKTAYEKQKDSITYFHMKDALMKDGSVVSVGNGDGSVPYILEDYNKKTDAEVILTVEPHLHVFNGLNNLQDEALKHKEAYPDSKTAFHAACSAVKKIINNL